MLVDEMFITYKIEKYNAKQAASKQRPYYSRVAIT